MDLKRVTITGADDATSIHEMVELSLKYPFVEWGILVSKKNEGRERFPSRGWINEYCSHVRRGGRFQGLRTSMHVCGKWVRDMLLGHLDWSELPECLEVCQRIQINTHAEVHNTLPEMLEKLAEQKEKEFIFQWDGINNHLAYAAFGYGLEVSALFDKSGGAGVLPSEWPAPVETFMCGYAGGLGPHNVAEQLTKIAQVAHYNPVWIDMEGRVRNEISVSTDVSKLDMSKVAAVLEATKVWMAQHKLELEPPF